MSTAAYIIRTYEYGTRIFLHSTAVALVSLLIRVVENIEHVLLYTVVLYVPAVVTTWYLYDVLLPGTFVVTVLVV